MTTGNGTSAPLLTYEQAGELLGCTDRTIRNMVYRGDLQPVRFSKGHVRFERRDLERLIEARKVSPLGPANAPET